jgi:hypothetical protein
MRLESTTSLMVADVTSTTGESPATVIVSARVPSSIVKFTVRFSFACSRTPLRCDVRNPVSSAVMSYVAGRSAVNV